MKIGAMFDCRLCDFVTYSKKAFRKHIVEQHNQSKL